MLLANAWHSRSDAISSIVVVIGVVGTMAGFHYLDAVAAVVVALMIAKIGWDLLWKSLQELIDTALEPEQVAEIRNTIMSVNGVRACHMLRTRHSGSDVLADVHILVDPALSVSEGHQIGETVRRRLIDTNEDVSDVPLRNEILRRLGKQWQHIDFGTDIDKVVLHYLDGKVHVDVFLPLNGMSPEKSDELSAMIREAALKAEDIGDVCVYYQS
jgi:divalent metal cation (Fe/Co/Zn/Cd) transporter